MVLNKTILWDNFLKKMKEQITSLAFETWFNNTSLVELVDDKAIVLVPTHVHKKHLTENYGDIIAETMNSVTETNFNIEYVLEDEVRKNIKENVVIGVPTDQFKSNLNSKYDFDNFVIGESNRFAHTAAVSVAESPGKMYNPLFIYAKSGLGKTHLMHSIGNYITKHSNKRVLYITSEQFISDFIGVNNRSENNIDKVNSFKDKYRNIDVLMIDDIQFLESATKTQQEFFHTFNNLYEESKQIIIASDRSVDDLKLLEDRLKTRFYWGMTVKILPPDFELRINILKKKIESQKMDKKLSNDVIEYVASNCESDVRQLEGAITRLYAFAAMYNNCDINLDFANDALKDFLTHNVSFKNNIQKIQRVVADYYKISVDDLKSKKRQYDISHPRQVAMYLSRLLTDESYPKIGIEFGGKDHSTVIHSYEKIDEEVKKNDELAKVVNNLKKSIN